MGKRGVLLACLMVGGALAKIEAQPADWSTEFGAREAMKAIQGEAIRGHMRFLSDSLLEGRESGTRGYNIAARYVQSQMEGMKLRPAGMHGTWYQPVPLRKAVVEAGKSSIALMRPGKEQKLVDAKDYVLIPSMVRLESAVEAPVMFVGFGVTAPGEKYDDYTGADVRGKVVAVVGGAPAQFPSTERAYFSDGVMKEKNAIAHGAVGILNVTLPEDWKRYSWEWLVPQEQAGSMAWLDAKGTPHNGFPELKLEAVLSETGAEALFTGAPKTMQEAFAQVRSGKARAFALGVSVKAGTVSRQSALESPNVVGMLEGSDPQLRNEYVVYTAHLDHLGICPAVNGDRVCHGAVDNASGTGALLEIARAYTHLPKPPRRSVLFVFVTGEEMGLLGSDYFARFPTVPRKAMVANVNIDETPGLYYDMKDVVPLGIEHSSLAATVGAAAAAMGYTLSPDPMPEEVGFIRSDQYSFVLQGIPAVDITDGVLAVDPKIKGLEVQKKWLVTRYHTPADNMEQPLDYASGAKGAQMNFLVGYGVCQEEKPPVWNAGDFFGSRVNE